ncbi:PRC-barrel domain-containing protein [Streptomyces sp. ISL-10]|uniref:PRC-barrel domain-containing protein n=1 Tax=Streptomyces sp. ISL-10 TaxID=2819172 RepID=UPI001BEB7A4C|nr:PRC-barrel domain-containing protein [Streptomyces sp. ISL-10]MBT2367281.1 PRC-barrel domain-containing protein [Streptomyces sp. ISL-10]
MTVDALDAGLDLLDRQVIDRDGKLLGKVDDLRFDDSAAGSPPVLAALLIGQRAFGQRLGGRLGRWWVAVAGRMAGGATPVEVSVRHVRELGPALTLDVRAESLPGLGRAERLLSHGFVGKIPGAHRESK